MSLNHFDTAVAPFLQVIDLRAGSIRRSTAFIVDDAAQIGNASARLHERPSFETNARANLGTAIEHVTAALEALKACAERYDALPVTDEQLQAAE